MSLLAGHDMSVGLADGLARTLGLSPFDIETRSDLMLDAPLLVRSVGRASVRDPLLPRND